MKSLSAKRIAAVAASLLMGMAVAGQGVTFGNIPIINSAGQPVVQIVIGSTAQPSDGVVAANIAAAIGSLAHTSQNITATVNGRSGVTCVVTTPTCTLSNQQVWLGEKGFSVGAGSYSFTALIGSVLNGGVLNSGTLIATKGLNGASSQFVYADSTSAPYAINPSSPSVASAYEGLGITPAATVSAGSGSNGATGVFGGGTSWTRFTNNTGSVDNIVRLSNSQVPGLLSSSGSYQETEYLWFGGFPVYNQASNVSNFALLDTQAAYQVVFGKPIQNMTGGAATNAQFTLLGQNWTVYSFHPPKLSGTGVTSNSFVVGGNVTLAQATTPLTTVYVGHNLTSGPFTVVLNDLSYPTSSGQSAAALSIYKNGVLTNVTSVGPSSPNGNSITINATGTKLYISVTQTFPGLYAYQKWAKVQLFSNTFNVTSGKDFNDNTNGHNWLTLLRWTTNQTSSSSASAANAALQSIILYTNQTQANMLNPGKSITIIGNPATWKLTFVGDALGTPGSGNTNYDQLSFSTGGSTSPTTYANSGGGLSTVTVEQWTAGAFSGGTATWGTSVNTTLVSEPTSLFSVSSSLTNAFLVGNVPAGMLAPTSNLGTLTYDLDSYKFAPTYGVNALGTSNLNNQNSPGMVVKLTNNGVNGNYISSTNQFNVQVTGYKSGQSSTTSQTVTFSPSGGMGTGNVLTQTISTVLANLTDITLSYPLPSPGVTVQVYETPNTGNAITTGAGGNDILLGTLSYAGPVLLYNVPSVSYYEAPNALTATVQYDGESTNVNFVLGLGVAGTGARNQYFNYTLPGITSPTSSSPNSNVIIGITNSSSILSTPEYYINVSNGNNNAFTYQSTQNNLVRAGQGFRTERGGEVASVSTTTATFDMARSVDGLQFVVGPASSNSTSKTALYGPYTVGQGTNIPNVTIAKVNATCTFSTTSCTVSGLNNLTATPSAKAAVVAVPLNTATTPLAVLDSQANNASTLIVVGSKYVNSVAVQIFNQNPSFAQSFGATGPNSVVVKAFGTNRILVAGYTADQTVQAGNQFIQSLLASAST